MLEFYNDGDWPGFVQCSMFPDSSLRHMRKCYRALQPTSVVILGGSSGVGLQVARYLRTKSVTVRNFSRRTGHDLHSPSKVTTALEHAHEGVAVCIGAGVRPSSINEELKLYTNVITALSTAKDTGLVVAVVRSLVLAEIRNLLSFNLKSPWVILRPGAIVDRPKYADEANFDFCEKLFVTPDIRCNGLVSRQSVGRVVGDLLLGTVAINEVDRQILGIYDEERMISRPQGCKSVEISL